MKEYFAISAEIISEVSLVWTLAVGRVSMSRFLFFMCAAVVFQAGSASALTIYEDGGFPEKETYVQVKHVQTEPPKLPELKTLAFVTKPSDDSNSKGSKLR